MANQNFGNSWYVRKDRIQLFVPLKNDLNFEINKSTSGRLNPDSNAIFGTSINGYPMTMNDSSVYSILFTGLDGSMKRLSFMNEDAEGIPLNTLINNLVYNAGSKCTINFWTFPVNDTTRGIDIGIVNNFVLADTYSQGYAFGFDTHTSMMDGNKLSEEPYNGNRDTFNSIHMLTALSSTQKVSGNESELEDRPDTSTAPLFDILNQRWIMTTIVIDNSDSTNYKSTIHLRWLNNGEMCHYWKTKENLGKFSWEGGTVVNRNAGVWNIGCTMIGSGTLTPNFFFVGGLRNLMFYNVALTNNQQNLIFSNGIDPYVIENAHNTDQDVDQYDKRMWGKYGIISTGSNVSIEKSVISKTTASVNGYTMAENSSSIEQNKKRFSVVARDSAKVVVARNSVASNKSETANPKFDDSTNDLNSFGSLSVAAWRGGEIIGDKNLSESESRALWGGLINGISDMMEIDKDTNPETLPSGKYIAKWILSGTDNANYPSFLPKYYYRDRLGKSWRKDGSTVSGTSGNNANGYKFVQEIFWQDDIKRFERIEWTKVKISSNDGTSGNNNSGGDEYQIDQAEYWEPVYWITALYEIDRDPSMNYANNGTNGFANRIKLILVSNDGKASAVYYKYRNQSTNKYSNWQFDSFNPAIDKNDTATTGADDSESKFAQEQLRRIYLPHITIPHLTIPYFRDSVKAETYDIGSKKAEGLESSILYGGCSLVFGGGKMLAWIDDMVQYVDSNQSNWPVPEDGIYMVIFSAANILDNSHLWHHVECLDSIDTNDPQYIRIFRTYTTIIYNMYSDVDIYCQGLSAYEIFFARKGTRIKMYTARRDSNKFAILLSPRTSHTSGKIVTGVNVVESNGNIDQPGYDNRYNSYVRQDSDGKYYIELANIGAKYTKTDYSSGSNPGIPSSEHVPIASTITNTTESQYDE